MKKRILAFVLVAALAFTMSFSAFGLTAAAASANQKITTTAKTLTAEQRTEINRLHGIVLENRAMVLSLKSQNVTQANQLKTLLTELKANADKKLSADDLAALKNLKNELASKREQLKTSVGNINTLMASYRDFRKDKNYDSMVSTLNQVITIQQNRIALCTEIGTLTQQMIDLLQGA